VSHSVSGSALLTMTGADGHNNQLRLIIFVAIHICNVVRERLNTIYCSTISVVRRRGRADWPIRLTRHGM